MRINRQITKQQTLKSKMFFEKCCDLIELAKTISNCFLHGQFTALENAIFAFQKGRADITSEYLEKFISNLREEIEKNL